MQGDADARTHTGNAFLRIRQVSVFPRIVYDRMRIKVNEWNKILRYQKSKEETVTPNLPRALQCPAHDASGVVVTRMLQTDGSLPCTCSLGLSQRLCGISTENILSLLRARVNYGDH